MAVKDVPDVSDFDRPDLRLAPETHRAQAEMAAERGEEYDPYEYERRIDEWMEDAPDPIEGAEPVEGKEELFEEWRTALDGDE
ncbi:hypothetical protein ACFQPA_13910 [Halomarina halobia]|uniref:CopG family transcriptional regulator n=1 Tax=Halomarina halobia TaxID=3033386 RepID=A0ABD6A8C3_9EURY|nr:hypothetical protein [Halomarina sp. PSR21]